MLSSGVVAPLTDPLLIGRAPHAHPGEIARTLIAPDPSRRVSKTHLELRPEDGQVFVIDRGSTNGTMIVRGEQVLRCEAGRRALLEPGDRVHFGPLSLVIEPDAPQGGVFHSSAVTY